MLEGWTNLASKFDQLKRESAMERSGPKEPPSRLTAVRTLRKGKSSLGPWVLEYVDDGDDTSVVARFRRLACEGAVLLGFSGDDKSALQFWIGEIRSNASSAYVRVLKTAGARATQQIRSEQISDIPGISALFCCKRKSDAIRAARIETWETAPRTANTLYTLDIQRIRTWMDGEGYSYRELGEAMNASRRTLVSMLNNGNIHGKQAVIKLANLMRLEHWTELLVTTTAGRGKSLATTGDLFEFRRHR